MDEFVLQARIHHSRGEGKWGQTESGIGDRAALKPASPPIVLADSSTTRVRKNEKTGPGRRVASGWGGGYPLPLILFSTERAEHKNNYCIASRSSQLSGTITDRPSSVACAPRASSAIANLVPGTPVHGIKKESLVGLTYSTGKARSTHIPSRSPRTFTRSRYTKILNR